MTERKKLRVLGHGRVSTRGQFLKGTSTKDQKASVKKECKAKGWEYVGFISDDGISGKTIEDRPAIREIKKLAEGNKFDCLMFTKLDRVGRNLRELENFWKLIEEDFGRRIYCIDQPFINDPKMGKMIRQLLGIFAEFEREMILERTKRGQLSQWQDGKAKIGLLPYGYDWDKKKKCIIEHPEQAPIYEKIVSKYLDEHYCFIDIANWMTEQGIPNRLQKRTKRWNGATVGSTLKNPAYKGEPVTYNQYDREGKLKPANEWVKITYPALISKDRWNQIQTRIEINKQIAKKKHYKAYDRFICDGVLWCFYDEAKIRKHLGYDQGKFYPYYRCGTNMRQAKDLKMKGKKRCILKSVDADLIDAEVWGEAKILLSDPYHYIKEWIKDPDREQIEDEYGRVKKRADDLEKKIKRNTKELFELAGESRKQMKVQLGQAAKELESEQRKLTELENELEFYTKKEDKLKEFEKAISSFRATRTKSKFEKAKKQADELAYRNSFKAEIIRQLDSLPAKDKKRIIEAVVKPEAGGKILVRYPTGYDLADGISSYTKEDLSQPLTDREPILEYDFKVDVNGIMALIGSLRNKDLYNKTSQRHIGV